MRSHRKIQDGYHMFTQLHTDHKMKCKIGHKWLGYHHLASVPVVLIQIGHHTVVAIEHITDTVKQLHTQDSLIIFYSEMNYHAGHLGSQKYIQFSLMLPLRAQKYLFILPLLNATRNSFYFLTSRRKTVL